MEYSRGAAIGVATYRGWQRVRGLLENIKQRTDGASYPFTVVVCDDSGREDHRERIREACRDYRAMCVEHPVNRGLPAAWNSLVRATDHEIVVLLNDDVLLARDWLSYLSYAVLRNPKVATVSLNCRFITPDDATEILKGPEAKVIPLNVRYVNGVLVRHERFSSMPEQPDDWPGKVMCPMGAAFAFRRSVYDQVGGFDERYRCFYEETDFGVACARQGMPSITIPVPHDNYHMWSATFSSSPEVPAGQIMNESRAKFVAKWSEILGVRFSDAPEIHNLLMDKIPQFEVKWLGVGKRERAQVM